MKKLVQFVLAALALCVFGCSSAPAIDDDSRPDGPEIEVVGDVQQAFGTCTRPTGSSGSQVAPAVDYITGVWPDPTDPTRLKIEATEIGTGITSIGYVDFGDNQALFTGPGWSGTKITSMMVRATNSSDCLPGDSDNFCWAINGTNAIYMNQQVSNLVSAVGIGSQQNFGDGITKIRGYGQFDTQRMRIYYDNSAGGIAASNWTVLGPAMNTCADPG